MSSVTPEDNGAVKERATDCTVAFQDAINAAIADRKELRLAAGHGKYLITDTLNIPDRITVRGYSQQDSVIQFNTAVVDKPCLFLNAQAADASIIEYIGIMGVGRNGIGIQIGQDGQHSSYGLFSHLMFHSLNVGIWHREGIWNKINDILVGAGNVGIRFTGHHVTSLFNLVVSGVDDVGLEMDSGALFWYSLGAEGNGLYGGEGVAVRQTGGRMFAQGLWLEGTQQRHFSVGEDTGRVADCHVKHTVLAQWDKPSIFDKIDYLSLDVSGRDLYFNSVNFTDEVRCRDINIWHDRGQNAARFYIDSGINKCATEPIVATDFRDHMITGAYQFNHYWRIAEVQSGVSVSVVDGRLRLTTDSPTHRDVKFQLNKALLERHGWCDFSIVMRMRANPDFAEVFRSARFEYGGNGSFATPDFAYIYPSHLNLKTPDDWWVIHILVSYDDAVALSSGGIKNPDDIDAIWFHVGLTGTGAVLDISNLSIYAAGNIRMPTEWKNVG